MAGNVFLTGTIFDSKYPYEQLWNYFYQHVGGMLNSHFYDISTYAGAVFACIIMFFVKKHIKNKWVNIILVSVLSLGFYGICSYLSFRIKMNSIWTLVAFVAPMSFLFIIKLLRGDWKRRLIVYVGIIMIFVYNVIYCHFMEDHHKTCYVIKMIVLIFGIGGYISNLYFDICAKKIVNVDENTSQGNKDSKGLGEEE